MARAKITANTITLPIKAGSNIEEYAERLARLIDWQGKLIEQFDGYPYILGCSNDWWMGIGDTDQEIVIDYRHGNIEFMTQLRAVLMVILGLKDDTVH